MPLRPPSTPPSKQFSMVWFYRRHCVLYVSPFSFTGTSTMFATQKNHWRASSGGSGCAVSDSRVKAWVLGVSLASTICLVITFFEKPATYYGKKKFFIVIFGGLDHKLVTDQWQKEAFEKKVFGARSYSAWLLPFLPRYQKMLRFFMKRT